MWSLGPSVTCRGDGRGGLEPERAGEEGGMEREAGEGGMGNPQDSNSIRRNLHRASYYQLVGGEREI